MRKAALRVVVAVILVAATYMAARTMMDDDTGRPFPSFSSFAVALIPVVGAVHCGARGWSTFVAGDGRSGDLRMGYVISQLAKYVPGGVWQFAGQAYSASRQGLSRSRAAGLVLIFTGLFAATAAAFAVVAAVFLDASASVRVALVTCALAAVFGARGFAASLINRAARIRMMQSVASTLQMPARHHWNASVLYLSAHHVLQGVGLAIVLGEAEQTAVAIVFSYPVAWLAGLLAVPIPSGIGVREAVLVVLLAPTAGALVIGAAIAHRLLNLIAEGGWTLAEHAYARAQVRSSHRART